MPEPKRRASPLRRALHLTILSVFVLFIGWSLVRQWSDVRAALGQLSLSALGLSALAAVAATWGGFLGWKAVLADFGSAPPATAAMRIFFVGQLGKYLPGKVWPIVTQARLGRDYGVPGRASAAAALIVMATTLGTGLLVTVALLPALGAGALDRYWWTALVLPVAAVMLWPPILNRLLDRALRLAGREPMPRPLSWRGIGAAVGWSLVAWLLFGIHLWLLLVDLGAPTDGLIPRSIGAFAGSWAIGFLLAAAPAGVGGREVALIVLLAGGVDQPTALVAAVVSRLLLTLADLALPALAATLERRRRRRVANRAGGRRDLGRGRPSGAPVRWVAFGTYDVARHPRVGVLIEGLRAGGADVTEVNAPLDLDTAARVAMLRQPWRLPLLAVKLARCWIALITRSRPFRRDRVADVDAVLVGYLGHFDVRLARRLFPDAVIVLDHLVSAAGTASDRGLAGGTGAKARLLRAIDKGALARADVVVVDTREHAAALPTSAAERAVVVPVGAGGEWFRAGTDAPHDRVSTRALRAIFVGLFTPLHGAPTLGAALGELAETEAVEVTMVGTGQEYAQCRRAAAANPRVTWIDWVPAADLPALVAGHDVCLGIFGTTEKARNVVPTKVFQGAAAGCAIVTSDTPPQRAALGEGALYVPAGDATALAGALRRLAEDREALDRLREAATRVARGFAAAAVVEPLRLHLAAALSGADAVDQNPLTTPVGPRPGGSVEEAG